MLAAKQIILEPERIPYSWEMTAPSDRVRFGIIGVGMQGNGLLATAITTRRTAGRVADSAVE